MGCNAILPTECMEGLPKDISSKAYFDRIVNIYNDTVLIINSTKDGIENYIGPNTFSEIAFAFYYNKDNLLT